MPHGLEHAVPIGPQFSGSRWWYGVSIVMLLGALASYGIPINTDHPSGAAISLFWHYVVRPHINQSDSLWSGHGLRLLLTAAIWCLGGSLILTVHAVRSPHNQHSRWLIGLSVVNSGLSIWIFVAAQRVLGDGASAPGAVMACGASGAALIGTLIVAFHRRKRSS